MQPKEDGGPSKEKDEVVVKADTAAGASKGKDAVEEIVQMADVQEKVVPEKAPGSSTVPPVPECSESKDPKTEAVPENPKMVYELQELDNSADPPHFRSGFSESKGLWWLTEIATGLTRYAHAPSSLNLPKEVVDSLNSGVPYTGHIAPTGFYAFRASVANTLPPKEPEEPDAKRLKKTEDADKVVDGLR